MKLAELGLKTKPATKYNDHLYVSFKTIDKVLYYRITFFQSKSLMMRSQWLLVKDKEHYEKLLKLKGNEVPKDKNVQWSETVVKNRNVLKKENIHA